MASARDAPRMDKTKSGSAPVVATDTAAPPAPRAALSAQPEQPPPIGKLVYRARLAETPHSSVAERYASLERQRILDEWKQDPDYAQAYLSDPGRFRYRGVAKSQIAFMDGDDVVVWVFEPPVNEARWPSRAWTLIDHGNEGQYDLERIGYCDDGAEICAAWLAKELSRALAPNTAYDSNSYSQWLSHVMTEPCESVPAFRPSQSTMQVAISRSPMKSAKMSLIVVLNPCGEVRNVSIQTSSHDRDIDRAAIQWAQRAIFPEQTAATPGHGIVGLIPFDFATGD
jgi:TonB family protein